MKAIVNVYKDIGKGVTNSLSKTSQLSPLNFHSRAVFVGDHVTHWSTPGKLQYYTIEMYPHLSDEIKYGLRLPTRFAMRQEKLTYLPQIEQEVTQYLKEKIKVDFFEPGRDLSLALTVQEAEIMNSAYPGIVGMAEKGDLKKLHEDHSRLQEKVEVDYLKTRDLLQRVRQNVEEKENAIYQKFFDAGVRSLKQHGDESILDTLALQTKNSSLENFIIIDAFVEDNRGEMTTDLLEGRDSLVSHLAVKFKIADLETKIQKHLVNKVLPNETAASNELDELANLKESFGTSLEIVRKNHPGEPNSEARTYLDQLAEIEATQLKELEELFGKFAVVHNDRERVYHNFLNYEESEYLDNLRGDLLSHLAGNLVVKENRNRYQKEQYDRYVASMMCQDLQKSNITLAQFCLTYARMVEYLITESHNGRSPKIDANYDDFAERTSRPINGTIFYYFFSFDQRKRTIAQWLLSTVRYPNEKVRKAYMRFFA